MKQVLDVLCVVEGGGSIGSFRCLLLVSRFARIYSFPNAEFSEIRKTDLEFSHSLSSGNEVLSLTRGPFLLNSSHVCGDSWNNEVQVTGGEDLVKRKINFFEPGPL